jgi:hypothetical protein
MGYFKNNTAERQDVLNLKTTYEWNLKAYKRHQFLLIVCITDVARASPITWKTVQENLLCQKAFFWRNEAKKWEKLFSIDKNFHPVKRNKKCEAEEEEKSYLDQFLSSFAEWSLCCSNVFCILVFSNGRKNRLFSLCGDILMHGDSNINVTVSLYRKKQVNTCWWKTHKIKRWSKQAR